MFKKNQKKTRLLCDAVEVLIPELTHLFNLCIEIGNIPRACCHAYGNIYPIPKTK